jgi:protein phosphatase
MSFAYLDSAFLTDVGRKRQTNEDAVVTIPEAGVFCVADGMGGAACGEVASGWAVEELQKAFAAPHVTASIERIGEALNRASTRIKAMAEERGVSGAGTTAVVLCFDRQNPGQATVLHAGDSRAYRVRQGKLECLTADHSMAEAAGVKHDKALPSIFRGVVTRAVGLSEAVELEETRLAVEGGDLYFLCSDGLSRTVPERKLQKLIQKVDDADLAALARELIETANNEGGDDNISVVLVRVSADLPDHPPPTTETVDHAPPPDDVDPLPPVEDEALDTPDEFAGHTPDSGDSLVGITPVTGHTADAGRVRADASRTAADTDDTQPPASESRPEAGRDERMDPGFPPGDDLSSEDTPRTPTAVEADGAEGVETAEGAAPAAEPAGEQAARRKRTVIIMAAVAILVALAVVLWLWAA